MSFEFNTLSDFKKVMGFNEKQGFDTNHRKDFRNVLK